MVFVNVSLFVAERVKAFEVVEFTVMVMVAPDVHVLVTERLFEAV